MSALHVNFLIKGPKKMSKAKATHTGHCQICNNIHKVDPTTGLLADHGYTVKYGFFMGSCYGARFQPIETSRNRIQDAITDAQQYVAIKNEKIDRLQSEENRTVYLDMYIKRLHKRKNVCGKLTERNNQFVIVFSAGDALEQYPEGMEYCTNYSNTSIYDQVQLINRLYVTGLQNNVSMTLEHIERLKNRYDHWKPGKLAPVEPESVPVDKSLVDVPLKRSEQNLLDLIKKRGYAINDEVAYDLRTTTRRIGHTASGLVKRGLITREQKSGLTIYRIVEAKK